MEHVPDAPDYLDVGTTLLPLGDITMIVGGPGSGKSTLLAAIAMAASSIRALERGTDPWMLLAGPSRGQPRGSAGRCVPHP